MIVGGWSIAQSFAWTLRSVVTIERAYALAPTDGRIAARLSEKLAGQTVADRAYVDRLAREALSRDPTAVEAVAALGINAEIRGDRQAARRLFAYSQKLSRRDLPTQVWAIEDAVIRGDVPLVLRHYDIALRTSHSAPDLLFPILSTAIADPAVRKALVQTLSARPQWTQAFLENIVAGSIDPPMLAGFFTDVRRARILISDHAHMMVVTRLAGAGSFEQAWRYYAAVRPGADRRSSRDPRFTATLAYPTPFDWTLADGAGISTSIQRGDRGGGILDFAVPSSVGGLLASQMQMLLPGDYSLEGHSANLDQPQGSRPYWTMTCQDGRELGRVAVPPSAQAGGNFALRFTVPAGCAVQTMSLTARPADTVSGVTGQMDYVRLRWLR